MRFAAALLVAGVVGLSGCAATVSRPEGQAPQASLKIPAASAQRVVLNMQLDAKHPKDASWATFRQEWIDITQERAKQKGLAFAVQDGAAKTDNEAGTLLVVQVKDYRHVGVGARMLGGIMTGNAFINADIAFRDLRSGTVYGERTYNTSSSAGQGVFAAMTPKQIYAIVDEALAEIERR